MDIKPHSVTQLVGEKWGGDENGTIRKWSDFVRGDDGSLYGVPFDAPRVIRFDPRDKSLTEIGPDLSDAGTSKKWKCGVKAIGGTIYCAPYMAKEFLKIETATGTHPDSAVRILKNVPLPENHVDAMYTSGALCDEVLYFMPAAARYILKLVPNIEDSKVTLSKASERDFGGAGWKYETVCGEDGLIYGIPAEGAGRTIKFDPVHPGENLDLPTDPPTSSEGLSWGKAVAAGDCIFSLNDKGQVLQFNTKTVTHITIGPNIYPRGWGWGDPVIGQDRCIYWPPLSAGKVLKFNPRTLLPPSEVGDDFGSRSIYKWHSGVLVNDGFIYCIPYCGHQVLEIDTRPVNPYLKKSSVGGATDSIMTTPDRLNYHDYAEGLCEVVRSIESPLESLCVAIFGTWGSGKSFFWELNVGELEKGGEAVRDEIKNRMNEEIVPKSERSWVLAWTWYARFAKMFSCMFCRWSHLREEELVAMMMILLCIPGLFVWCAAFSISWLSQSSKEVCIYMHIKSCCNKQGQNDYAALWQEKYGEKLKMKDNDPVICKVRRKEKKNPGDTNQDELKWSQVRNVLTGKIDLYADRDFRKERIRGFAQLQIMFLTFFQKSFEKIVSKLLSLKFYFDDYKIEERMTKYIFVKFNAWEYCGTDLLWAKFIETLWNNVERECGKYTVRLHRAKISLSDENENDDIVAIQNKRDSAILFYVFKVTLSFLLAFTVTTVAIFVVQKKENITEEGIKALITDPSETAAAVALSASSSLPLLYYVIYFLVKFIPEILGSSKGTKILEQARRFHKHNRPDFSQKTGFMGEVHKEVEYLFDFLRTTYVRDHGTKRRRPLRMANFIDDLDRCPKEIIMQVLQVVVLLLTDAPVTCWLAIDSRIVTAHIEEYFGDRFIEAGLNGYQYLEKIVQLPFCLPDVEEDIKKNFLRKMLESNELNPLRIYNRLKFLDVQNIQEISSFFTPLDRPPPSDEEAFYALIPTLRKMVNQGVLVSEEEKIKEESSGVTKPSEVLQRMVFESETSFFKITSPGQRRLFDEFLHWISIGIELTLQKRIKGLTSEDHFIIANPDVNAPGSFVDKVPPLGALKEDYRGALSPVKAQSQPGSLKRSDSLRRSMTSLPDPSIGFTHRNGNIYENVFRPRASPQELEWFDTYAKFLMGKPRKMNRIVNTYMVSRSIAGKKNPTLPPHHIFFKNILKFTILLEQWPYRMAWTLLVVENIQQEIDTQELIRNGKVRQRISSDAIGENLISLVARLTGQSIPTNDSLTQENCLDIPLIHIYDRFVQVLIHSSDDAAIQLQRDGDPQVFENILLDGGEDDLKFRDIGLREIKGCERTLRRYAFNLQTHMIEKVSVEIENLSLFSRKTKSTSETSGYRVESNHSVTKEDWITYEKKSSLYDYTTNKHNILDGIFPRALQRPLNGGERNVVTKGSSMHIAEETYDVENQVDAESDENLSFASDDDATNRGSNQNTHLVSPISLARGGYADDGEINALSYIMN